MAIKNECFTCRQSKKSQRSSVMCTGCSQRFCKPHHQEHRQAIEKDFGRIIEQHNALRQRLFNDNDENNTTKVNLLKKIDKWEKEMTKAIQTIAAETKTRLINLLSEEKNQLKNNFTVMANEIKESQSSNEYVETDIQAWQKQINDYKLKFEQIILSKDGNAIDVSVQPISFDNSISVGRSSDIKIKTTNSAAAARAATQEIKLTCTICDKSFPKSSGHVEFCSASCCETYKNRHFDESSPDEDGGDGCFHENCVVLLTNGLTKFVKDVRRGDVLRTSDGSEATVTYVVKISCSNNKASMVTLDSGLIITPWHPVRIDGTWKFPRDIRCETKVDCRAVYNFALDRNHISIINGVECVTLGHNFKGEIIEHPYFGTDKVLEDLRAHDTLNTGFIELLPKPMTRDDHTKLITGIRMSHKTSTLIAS